MDTYNHCVTGDTLVDTENGQISIKDLVGTNGKVNCFDLQNNIATTSNYFDVRKTRDKAKVYEIETESGQKIKATSDHLILTTQGWKMVCELNYDDEIIKI
ncbi:Hint domain-containing protein [Staphylococcus sp. 47.1]|uniref:Hint domain-containing protein n=1 Tax=Staphylococcus sp. 47.1 TaxID=1929484 RepID=UPI0021160350|nr:Hint domain-containing protein [Staphylococcus sp. 47.1]